MSGGLSQNEIDALLSQAQASDSEDQQTIVKKEKAVFTYNFRKQKKFNKNHYTLLEGIHKRFLRSFEITLTNLLTSPVMSTLAAATELSYNDCMDSFSSPTCIYILNVNDGMGKFILEIDPNFAFFVIDKILGGSSKDTHSMDRELSLIEERIMHRVVGFLLEDLADAWQRVDKLHFKIDSFYAQPDYVQVLSNTETVILVSMDVRSADKTLGYMNMCLPSSILEQLLHRYDHSVEDLSQLSVEESSTAQRDITFQMRKSVLPIRVVLGETKISVRDLIGLETGDVIYLHSTVNKPVDVFVGNLRLYKAMPVKKEKSMAVQISSIIRPIDPV